MRLNVKEYVAQRKEQLKQEIGKWTAAGNPQPSLLIVQVGNDERSNAYVRGKLNDAREVGIAATLLKGDLEWAKHSLDTVSNALQTHPAAIVQLPIEDKGVEAAFLDQVWPRTDVDGLKKGSNFTPCTPKGIVDYIKYGLDVDLKGTRVAVVGKGKLVGMPLVPLLMAEGATVLSCNSKTKDLDRTILDFAPDIIVGATGVPKILNSRNIPRGTVVIDAGMAVGADGKLCGDVDKDLYDREDIAITTVPGGVGLLTRLALMENTFEANKNWEMMWRAFSGRN